MANDTNDRLNLGGGESLNDRLRRAAAMQRAQQQAHPEANSPYAPRIKNEENVSEYQNNSRVDEPAVEQPKPEEVSPQDARHQHRNEEREYYTPSPAPKKGGKGLFALLIALLVVAALAVIALFVLNRKQASEQQAQIEQLQLANEQMQLANEYDALNTEFAQYENQTSLLANDSIVQKYSAARAQVEKLLKELQNEKNKSAAQIGKLKDEISTLKGILRNYVEQINALNQENQELRTENQEVKAQNQQLSQTVQHVQANNKVLNERMTLAEKLNVTGVNLVALNKKGKTEKNVTKARQLMVTFTIPQNNSTPEGEKVIWLRITNPEGDLLPGGGSFSFEGSTLAATARKTVEYGGEEIGGITIYWDVTTTLTPGDYTVELFCDNYRLCSRRFALKK